MSGNGQNEQESGKDDNGEAGRDMYRPKSVSIVVRVLTVMAYLLSVSMAAILLSVYYIWVWKSPELPPIGEAMLSARRGEHHEYQQYYSKDSLPFDYSGSGNITVNPNSTESFQANLLEPIYESTREHSGSDLTTNLTTEAASMLETTHEDSDSYDVGPDNNTNTIT
ncbi:unnamed protein product [Parnassius apollo]|uniref:(apollo) hypothetical protein n=1 Tax=Parnassius apollo TaxID=110799 RepID=A0A8S3WD78_PARAO|nr:unnamed protein product [Parnassius apollo]